MHGGRKKKREAYCVQKLNDVASVTHIHKVYNVSTAPHIHSINKVQNASGIDQYVRLSNKIKTILTVCMCFEHAVCPGTWLMITYRQLIFGRKNSTTRDRTPLMKTRRVCKQLLPLQSFQRE